MTLPPGLIWSWGWGHAQYVWDIRSHSKVGEIFENIYDTKELLVSFDGINCNLGALMSDQKFTYSAWIMSFGQGVECWC